MCRWVYPWKRNAAQRHRESHFVQAAVCGNKNDDRAVRVGGVSVRDRHRHATVVDGFPGFTAAVRMPLDSHRRLYLLLRLHVLASLLLPRSGSAAAVSAAGPVFKRNYQPQGAWGDFGEEASPFFLNGKMYHMQSVMGIMPEDGSEGTHSFFCIYDAATGAKVICPESSSKFAFCSAIVDHTVPADQRLWVFCSQWDRANKTYCPQPPPPPPPPAPRPGVFASAEQRAHSSTIGWGCGACSDAQRGVGDGCYVGAWSTSDLKTWSGPSKAVTLPLPFTVPNVAAAMIPPSSAGDLPPNLPKHQTFMAFEGGSFTALNIGTDRDLSKNWKLLPMVNRSSELCKNLSKEGKECATGLDCPTARYNPMDKYYCEPPPRHPPSHSQPPQSSS